MQLMPHTVGADENLIVDVSFDFARHPAFHGLTHPSVLWAHREELYAQLIAQRAESDAIRKGQGDGNASYNWRVPPSERPTPSWDQPFDNLADQKSRTIATQLYETDEQLLKAQTAWLAAERAALEDMRAHVKAARERFRQLKIRGVVPADPEWPFVLAYQTVAKRVGLM